MLDFFKTVNKVLRIVFIGFVAIFAIAEAFNIKSGKKETIIIDESEYVTSEFDDIW